MLRLSRFDAWNNADFSSYHCGSWPRGAAPPLRSGCRRGAARTRRGSRRRPSAASHAVETGPAQNAVKSSTVIPASGRSPTGSAVTAPRAGQAPVASASEGATSSRSATPWKRNGARGRIHRSPGCATSTLRSRKWSKFVSSAPLPTIAAGMRASTHAATTSSAVCTVACRRSSAGLTSLARRKRPIIVPSSASSAMSSRPITAASAWPLLRGDGRDADVAVVAGGLVAGDHHPAPTTRPAAREPRHRAWAPRC